MPFNLEIARLVTDSRIQIIASASSRASLPTDLTNFHGQQFFTDFLELPAMKQVSSNEKIYWQSKLRKSRLKMEKRWLSVLCG